MPQNPTFDQIADTIKRMEVSLGLLRDESYGIEARLAWEASRQSVLKQLSRHTGIHEASNRSAPRRKDRVRAALWHFANVVRSFTVKNPLRETRRGRVLMWGHPRRKKADDNTYEDIYTDPIRAELGDEQFIVVERPTQGKHLEPVSEKPVWHADFFQYLGDSFKAVLRRPRRSALQPMISDVREYLKSNTGIHLPVGRIITRRARSLDANRRSYRWMLRWMKPRSVLVLVAYDAKELVLAAKELDIPTFELQHGVISPYHLGYAVAAGETLRTFPDHVLLFGPFWKRTVEYPISSERLLEIGYPHISRETSRYADVAKKDMVAVISQGTIGDRLSRFAVQLAETMPENIELVYKLHPGERKVWQHDYPWLLEAADRRRLTVVSEFAPTLYALLAKARWQLGVYSTAIFEGIAFGCQTILVNLPGIEYMRPLIEENLAQVVDEPAEVQLSGAEVSVQARDDLFSPNWQASLTEALKTRAGWMSLRQHRSRRIVI